MQVELGKLASVRRSQIPMMALDDILSTESEPFSVWTAYSQQLNDLRLQDHNYTVKFLATSSSALVIMRSSA